MRNVYRIAVLAFVFVGLAACGKTEESKPQSTLTQHQRDSVLAESKLPGAGAVRGALSASDSAAARAQRLDDSDR